MFCTNCGENLKRGSQFCTNCGFSIFEGVGLVRKVQQEAGRFLRLLYSYCRKSQSASLKVLMGKVFLVVVGGVLLYVGYEAYLTYERAQQTIAATTKQLDEVRSQLSDIASSTSERLTHQEEQILKKDTQISNLEKNLRDSVVSGTAAATLGGKAIASLAPSVVKILCYSDRFKESVQLGSGVLYYSEDSSPSKYFIQTNEHVVKTEDGSLSECAIAVYPDYKDTSNYLVYEATGYKVYSYGTDFAYIIPQVTENKKAGTVEQLGIYAKKMTASTYCKATAIGDHMSILGYPSVGGLSLTVTDGIISGFEDDEGVRFIKTSAKIEHGNSGGVAIKDSGCILGIPTFVKTGTVESIGRILDLNSMFSK